MVQGKHPIPCGALAFPVWQRARPQWHGYLGEGVSWDVVEALNPSTHMVLEAHAADREDAMRLAERMREIVTR